MSVLIANKKKAKRRKLKKDINLECDKKYNLGSSVDIEEEKKNWIRYSNSSFYVPQSNDCECVFVPVCIWK